ncbi:MAG: fluoride efflux transporter CrcB [Salibacteraceae bacterium]
MNWLAIFIGGGLGSMARFAISRLMMQLELTQLPVATLSANAVSTAILGLALIKLSDHTSFFYYFLIVGFCGGFSTFSTFSQETFVLAKNGQLPWAIANVLNSVALCIFILYLISKTTK